MTEHEHQHEHEELETEVENGGEIITLFGMDGPVGKHFVKLALSAGYHIQALSPTPVELEHEYLTVFTGDLSVDESVLEELLRDSTYVVCLLTDATPKKDYPEGLLFNFIQRLYPLMKESPIRVFLYQATSTTVDTRGQAPMLANVVKFVTRNKFQKDQDSIIKYIGDHTEDWFYFIVTRPGLTWEAPSKKRLSASRSQPGPVPVANIDLAEFSLSALRIEKLYNTCPYVVGDGF